MLLSGLNPRRDWDGDLRLWGRGPSPTERERCEHAETAIRNALDKSERLPPVRVFAQGSYRNRTNVRQDSDVDICVLYDGSFFCDVPRCMNADMLGPPAVYTFDRFRSDVEDALVSHFGQSEVRPGRKAFDIKSNTYRVNADVAPCFEYQLHSEGAFGLMYEEKGTALLSRDGERFTNFPDQQYRNGTDKNERTGQRFKPMVRIYKNLCNEMKAAHVAEAEPIASFLLESLIWNVPNQIFSPNSLVERVHAVHGYLMSAMSSHQTWPLWREENGIKPLFAEAQDWDFGQVQRFLAEAARYMRSS